MQILKGVASGKQSFREHCATKWFLEANPRNISASKISRYTVYPIHGDCYIVAKCNMQNNALTVHMHMQS